ncbi:hypothetical protein HYQ45_015993 [Verticillium longisporum]|uniref:Uncharacterized protein n=1 Tax=Verticillium longisporum TaxID=100787 RepID=A0A8I2Z7R3_VERLO|nr:hypothetical protein HYQ45_015993 [Verticillium longisporum]
MATVSQPFEARAAATRDPLSLDPLDTDDTTGEDGLIDDDAQLVMQPALSVAATRLTLSRTPAAEKAAAMDMAPENPYFGSSAGANFYPTRPPSESIIKTNLSAKNVQ